MSTLEQRMEKLEKKLRLYQLAFISILLTGGFLIVSGFNKKNQVPDLIQAKGFQVVDDQGRALVSLKSYDNAGNIRLYDQNGTTLLEAYQNDAGAGAILTKSKDSKYSCYIGTYNNGAGQIKVYNSSEKAVDEIGSTVSDYGYFGVNNASENTILSVSSTANGDGVVSVFNRYKNRICILGPDDYGNGVLNVMNSSGQNMNGVWPKQ
ncbi:MAG TPA: hypothetical protein VHD35_12040 [Chitinophagaceae bacterium]|nr:hypothetical protein [Chitinophagaceae bacterium]